MQPKVKAREVEERHAQSWMRIILVIGAAACFVIGGKMVAQDIVYQVDLDDPFDLFFTLFPFPPLIVMAPRYKSGKVIYVFTGIAETMIIVMNQFIVLR